MKEITPMTAAKQALINQNKQGEILVSVIEHVEDIANHVDEVAEQNKKDNEETRKIVRQTQEIANDAVNHTYLSRGQLHQVRSAVASRSTGLAYQWIKLNHGNQYYGGGDYLSKKIGQVRSAVWSYLKDVCDANVYSEIRRVDYQLALKTVRNITLQQIPSYKIINKQTTLEALNQWELRKGYNLTEPKD